MSQTKAEHRFHLKGALFQDLIFFTCFFLVLLHWIKPVLYIESQHPVFLTGLNFLKERIQVPGGWMDWFSALAGQFLISNWAGALIITAIVWLIAWLTRQWLSLITDGNLIHTFHLIPAAFLLIMQTQYDDPISVTLNLCMALAVLVAWTKWKPKSAWIRMGVFFIVSFILYWISGGALLLFAFCHALSEIVLERRIWTGLFEGIFAACLPYAASLGVFLVGLKNAYLHGLAMSDPGRPLWAVCGLYAFFILSVMVVWFSRLQWIQGLTTKRIFSFHGLGWIIGTAAILIPVVLVARSTLDRQERILLQMNRDANLGMWSRILNSAGLYPAQDPLVLFQINRALYHNSELLDRMFAYPQTGQISDLLLDNDLCFLNPQEASDIFFELGLVGESQHWAHEAFTLKGPTPYLLKRLSLIYLLKGEKASANVFLRTLKKTLFDRRWAEKYAAHANDSLQTGSGDPLRAMRSFMPSTDYISLGHPSSRELEILCTQNPNNRMAFEYLLAAYLLNGRIGKITENLPRFRQYYPLQIPRHLQEALLIHAALMKNFDLNRLKENVGVSTLTRFTGFQKILARHKNDRFEAEPDLRQSFGDTYWYYLLFRRPQPKNTEK